MAERASLDPKDYPKPTKWHLGYVSKAQARKFQRTAKLHRYVNGMWANTPGKTRATKLKALPARLHPKKAKPRGKGRRR